MVIFLIVRIDRFMILLVGDGSIEGVRGSVEPNTGFASK